MQQGEIIDNHYELKHQLGRGSFGEVWLATDTYLGQDVALKFYVAMDDNGRQEFREEYRKVFRLRHGNLLTPSYYGEWNGQPYLVLEYCPASAAAQLGQLDEPTLWRFIADVADGLAYMHSSNPTLVHQDIKPANILQKTDGHYAITDFGISVSLRSTMLRQSGHEVSGSVGGSIPYMGPELFGAKPVPVMASDIWALGVTIYEMAIGTLPFMGQGGVMLKNGAELPILEGYSPELNNLMQSCLALNTWDRPTAENVAEQAGKYCSNVPPVRPQKTAEKPKTEYDDSATQKMPIQHIDAPTQKPIEQSNVESKDKLSSKVFWGVIGFIFLILFILFVEGLVQLNKYNKALSEFETYLNNGDINSLNLANTVLNNIKTIENGPNSYMITPRYDELKRKLDEKREGLSQQNDSEGVSIGILNSKIELSSYEVMDSGGKGGHVDITVITDAENYTATSNQSWCKITNQNDTSFRIEIEANATDSTREAIVTVTAGPQPKSVVVTQKPKPNDISATNSNSTNSSSSSSATQNKPKAQASNNTNSNNNNTNSNDVIWIQPNYRCEDSDVMIDKVTINNNYTIVEMSVEMPWLNQQYEDGWVSIDKATYIISQGKKYTLIKAEGIAYSPQKTIVALNHTFKLYFQPIPKNTQIFNLIENENSNWKFYGVRLNTRNSNTNNSSNNTTTTSSNNDKVYLAGYGYIEMVKVEGGTFTMGATSEQGSDAFNDERPTHSVTLSSYYIGKYEVTQGLWKVIMNKNPSEIQNDNYPINYVSWDECQEFVNKLNKKTGKKFRLPTEAEWEFAARGGNKSQGYKYSGSNDINHVAWYGGNSNNSIHPVGKKQANELGIYDMSGNVKEWCSDWFGSYSTHSQTNPIGESSGFDRVLRGGDWNSAAGIRLCRVSCRNRHTPYYGDECSGLRLVLDE